VTAIVADDKAADSQSGEHDRAHEEHPAHHGRQPQAPEPSAEHLGGKLMRRAGHLAETGIALQLARIQAGDGSC